jgi:hypothetical protein
MDGCCKMRCFAMLCGVLAVVTAVNTPTAHAELLTARLAPPSQSSGASTPYAGFAPAGGLRNDVASSGAPDVIALYRLLRQRGAELREELARSALIIGVTLIGGHAERLQPTPKTTPSTPKTTTSTPPMITTTPPGPNDPGAPPVVNTPPPPPTIPLPPPPGGSGQGPHGPNPTPEPSSLVSGLFGLTLMLAARRRRAAR